MNRIGKCKRTTSETDVSVSLTIDGNGTSTVNSGNAFMDHMLTLFAKHGLMDLTVNCNGDTDVDFHHSAEDIGISLGKALNDALGDFRGITRYATSYVPMDEALARVCIDLGGRSNLVYEVTLKDRVIGTFECDLVEDFFKALSDNAKITIHIDLLRGRNSHHSVEAIFKAFGRALCEACSINQRTPNELPTTKDVI